MDEDKKYWLNEYGERYWYKKSDMSITAHRAYHWVDRIIFIHESRVVWYEASELIPYGHYSTTDRHTKGETTYTKFKEEIDDWEPITNFNEYTLALKFELECRKYNI